MFRTGLAPSSGLGSWFWRRARTQLCSWGVAVVVAASAVVGVSVPGVALAKGAAPSTESVALQTLPPQARDTHQRILSGGPFPYSKDGTVFGNRERLLPRKARGYYHEYTVKTPGSRDRGARRIVCGGEPKTQPEVCYYTDDHYATFRRIAP